MDDRLSVTETGDLRVRYTDSHVSVPSYFRHFHDTYEINLFIRANIDIFVRDNNYKISDGDILFVNEFDIHSYSYSPMSHYIRYVLNFKRESVAPFLEALHVGTVLGDMAAMPIKQVHLNIRQLVEMESLFSLLFDASRQTDASGSPVSSAKTASLLQLIILRIYELLRAQNALKKSGGDFTLPQKILHYIDENFMQEISLDMLEKVFYANKFYISHTFKCETGFSILDICFECGFHNTQNFYRVFKKVAGVTPRQYRSLLDVK